MNKTGNDFFDTLEEIEQEKYKILFESKDSWYAKNSDGTINYTNSTAESLKISEYDNALLRFIRNQDENVRYDLRYIYFLDFAFKNFLFENKYIVFDFAKFGGVADFMGVEFSYGVQFFYAKFGGVADFQAARFGGMVSFDNTKFDEKAIFYDATFDGEISFKYAKFEKELILHNSAIKSINLLGLSAVNAIFLNMKGLNETNIVAINKSNFANKESVRLIKAHFEKQGNITEANKYFVIEQEKYIDELKDKENVTDGGKLIKLFPLYLNKYVSNFGTDWVRAVLFLLLFGIVFYSLFNIIKFKLNVSLDFGLLVAFLATSMAYKMTYVESKLNIPDKILIVVTLMLYFIWIYSLVGLEDLNNLIKLINPINAFKDDDTLKGYEAFGAFVRIGAAAIIYQIIVAFRQFTRRA